MLKYKIWHIERLKIMIVGQTFMYLSLFTKFWKFLMKLLKFQEQ